MVHGRSILCSAAIAFILGASAANAASKQAAVPGEFLVQLKSSQKVQVASLKSVFGAEGVRTVNRAQNLYLVKKNVLERSEYSMSSLSQSPLVEIVEPNLIYKLNRTPNDPLLGELWGMKNIAQKGGRAGIDIGAEAAWDIQTGSKKVLVAVIDTGLDYTHPDLAANAWTNLAEKNGKPGVDDDGNGYVDDIHGYDFANNDGDPMDDHGHGSHCSGTIGATGDDGRGIVGVSWNVQIMGVKFLSGDGGGTLEGAIQSIDYATKMGAQIQSNSWGGGGYTELLHQSIQRARDAGVLFVAAAGNGYNNNDIEATYPATYDVENIISVAAVDNSGQKADFSNWGKKTVHVAAPGVDVTSSIPLSLDKDDGNADGYATWSGTSMATPHVSGIAALLISQFPGITYQELREKIINGSAPVAALRSKVISGGIANAYYSLTGEAAPVDAEDPYYWKSKEEVLSSAHPYKDNFKAEFQVHVPGATQISLYFSRFEIEQASGGMVYDSVTFSDAKGNVVAVWTGTHNDEFTPVIPGDTVNLKFKTDESVNGYGFDLTKVAYKTE
jgi:thermitase